MTLPHEVQVYVRTEHFQQFSTILIENFAYIAKAIWSVVNAKLYYNIMQSTVSVATVQLAEEVAHTMWPFSR